MTANSIYLPKPELVFYASIYVTVGLYSAYQLLSQNNDIYKNTDPGGYSPGWSFIGRKQDRQDYEWSMWTSMVRRSALWIVAHVIVSELTRSMRTRVVKFCFIVSGMAFIFHSYGLNILVVMLFKVTTFLSVMTLGRSCWIWLYAIVWIVVTRLQAVDDLVTSLMPEQSFEHQSYEMWLMLSWSQLKIISVCLELMDDHRIGGEDEDILDAYSYVFYLPNLVCGPVFLFNQYTRMMHHRRISQIIKLRGRLHKLKLNILPVVGWYLLLEASLHIAYLSSLATNHELVNKLSALSLYSFGYVMSIQFFVKYRAMYGLSSALAEFDGMDTLPLPRYIGIVHWFSDMWKYFDTGLYQFLFRYIYAAFCCRSSPAYIKFAGSALTFIFVYLWHGMFDFILYWAILNFISVVIERAVRSWCRANQSIFNRYLSANNQSRLAAILGSQLFIVGALSNFLFFTGTEVGRVFVVRTYWTGGWMTYVCVTAMAVCVFHTSEWICRIEERKLMTRY